MPPAKRAGNDGAVTAAAPVPPWRLTTTSPTTWRSTMRRSARCVLPREGGSGSSPTPHAESHDPPPTRTPPPRRLSFRAAPGTRRHQGGMLVAPGCECHRVLTRRTPGALPRQPCLGDYSLAPGCLGGRERAPPQYPQTSSYAPALARAAAATHAPSLIALYPIAARCPRRRSSLPGRRSAPCGLGRRAGRRRRRCRARWLRRDRSCRRTPSFREAERGEDLAVSHLLASGRHRRRR
jgi:hypothetical protein